MTNALETAGSPEPFAPLPALSAHPLPTQVGGHPGVLTTEDNSLIIKSALPLELAFYQLLHQDPRFESLRPFVPKFLGTLTLEGKLEESMERTKEQHDPEAITIAEVEDPTPHQNEYLNLLLVFDQMYLSFFFDFLQTLSIVLENLSYSFLKPNILDVKLGTVLYDQDASPEKVARMIETARITTSLETGVRLTGFQVHDNITGQPVNTPKSFGKSIKPSELPLGIARFFPVGVPLPKDTQPQTEPDASAPSLPSTSTSGLPLPTLLPILKGIRKNVAEIRAALAQLEVRIVGGSLLIVYEAEWTRAEEGMKELAEEEDARDAEEARERSARGDRQMDEEQEEDEEEEDEEDEDDMPPNVPFIVKLIDFAHTRLAPGQGPDEGVLFGIDTVLKLLDGRIKELDTLSQLETKS